MFDVVCVGILVADVVARPVDALPPSGSLERIDEIALHTATALTRLGASAAVAGKVGRDPLGRFLADTLDERRIARGGVVSDDTTPTSASVALVAADGERTFLHVPGANARLRVEELERAFLLSGRRLHVAGALVLDAFDGEPCAALLADA